MLWCSSPYNSCKALNFIYTNMTSCHTCVCTWCFVLLLLSFTAKNIFARFTPEPFRIAALQRRNGPTVGSTISFSDDMCPIIRSSTQPQVIPNSPTFHHKTSCGTDTYRMINDFAPKATNLPHCSLHFDNRGAALKCCPPRHIHCSPSTIYIPCWGSWGESVFMRFLPIS